MSRPTGIAAAQETVNQATIGGRVVDPQGRPVPGALVSARQMDTNVTVEATTDTEGRFRFPYLRIGPYELPVRLQGFKENARHVALSAGSAFDLVDRARRRRPRNRRHGGRRRPVLETARSQIVGTVPQAEVRTCR